MTHTLIASCIAACVAATVAPAHAAGPSPAAFEPTRLDTSAPPADARAWLRASDVARAELGYLYALPAYLHARQRFEWTRNFTTYMPERGNPFGQFLLLREPTSPATADVMPNYDTLYGATFVDLGRSPVVLSVPDVPDRYYSVAILDAYFYNFAYVGSRTTGQRAGRYLVVPPGWKGEAPAGIADVIVAPTRWIHMYQRIYFRDAADVPAVRALQDAITVTPLAKVLDPRAAADAGDVADVLASDPLAVASPVDVLRIANAYMGLNRPPATDDALVREVARVGVGPGVALPTDGQALQVLTDGAADAYRTLTGLAMAGSPLVNGWQAPPPVVGERGTPVSMHAMTQLRSIGLNAPAEAVYYTTYGPGEGRDFIPGQAYRLHFPAGALPPVDTAKFGFWSITLYRRDNYRLYANPADRYVVRSGDPLVRNADGSLTILVQPERPADPAMAPNWLPSPAETGFVLTIRVYLGGEAILSGRYRPPAVVPSSD